MTFCIDPASSMAVEQTAGAHSLAAAAHRRRSPHQRKDRQLTCDHRWRAAWRSATAVRVGARVGALVLVLLFLFASASFVALRNAQAQARGLEAGRVYRIGLLRAAPWPTSWVEAFRQGLRGRGYVDGQNVVVEFRSTDGNVDQLPQLAEELVRSKVDVILASAAPSALAAKKATTSLPIVFVAVFDPVELGLVPSLARPGGNVTGLAFSSADLAGKRLQLFSELVPKLKRVAMLWEGANPGNLLQLKGAEAAARTLGMAFQSVPVRGPNDFDSAFRAVRGADGLLQADGALFLTHRARLVELAAASRLPVLYGVREMVDGGGLLSYGPHLPDQYRLGATYVDKILKGAKPADLPVEQPAKFELVVNLRTAKALGLTVPASLLVRADQIIE